MKPSIAWYVLSVIWIGVGLTCLVRPELRLFDAGVAFMVAALLWHARRKG